MVFLAFCRINYEDCKIRQRQREDFPLSQNSKNVRQFVPLNQSKVNMHRETINLQSTVYVVFRSNVALHSFRLKLCTVK